MPVTPEQRTWVASVLGLQTAGSEAEDQDSEPDFADEPFSEEAFRSRWSTATSGWREAMDAVDDQVNQLRIAMLRKGDPALAAIADGGLTSMTAGHKTPVMTTLFDIAQTSGEARLKAARKALAAYEAFRSHVQTDPRIAALDDNAKSVFGVDCAIREEISLGLDELTGAITFLLKAA